MSTDRLADRVEVFLDHLLVERQASAHTVAAYRNDLTALITVLEGCGVTRWEELENEHLVRFESTLANHLQKSSAQRKLSAIRSFLKYLQRNGTVVDAELPSTGGFRKPRLLPKALPKEQLDALFQAQIVECPRGLRDRALFELIYGAGLRISEAVELELSAIDFTGYLVRVFGKRGKTRLVPLPEGTVDWIRRYMERSRPALVRRPISQLIVSDRGATLSRGVAYTKLQRYKQSAGVLSGVSPHTLRHSFAVDMLKGGADLRVVQELLGHSSIASTQIYTQLDLEEVRRRYEQAHPRR